MRKKERRKKKWLILYVHTRAHLSFHASEEEDKNQREMKKMLFSAASDGNREERIINERMQQRDILARDHFSRRKL